MSNLKIIRVNKKDPSVKTINEMHKAYTSGLSLSKVGKKFGYSRQWVYSYFERRNLPMRRYKKDTPARTALVNRLYHIEGKRREVICKELHMSKWTVATILRKSKAK